jgi:hypothetical protein
MISSVVALIIFHKHIFICTIGMGHCRSTAECEMHREAWCLYYEPHHTISFLHFLFISFSCSYLWFDAEGSGLAIYCFIQRPVFVVYVLLRSRKIHR